jgi:hypothetical protein
LAVDYHYFEMRDSTRDVGKVRPGGLWAHANELGLYVVNMALA